MPRNQIVSALAVIGISIAGVVYTLIAGNQPLLGLDLQGGVSVVLEPTRVEGQEITDESLDLTVELLRSRIDEIGVAEPEISRQGQDIVVALPGVIDDQAEALDRLQQTAELRFRPVIFSLGAPTQAGDGLDPTGDSTGDGTGDTTGSPDQSSTTESSDSTVTTSSQDPTTSETSGGSTTTGSTDGEEESLAALVGRYGPLAPSQDETTTTASSEVTSTETSSTDQVESTTTEVGVAGTGDTEDTVDGEATDGESTLSEDQLAAIQACGTGEITSDDDDIADQYVVLEALSGEVLCLGPTMLTGETVDSATATLGIGGWQVDPSFKAGAEGIDQFNVAAALCFNGDTACPSRRLAIVLDHSVISAPSINAQQFSKDDIVVSGSFDESQARLLAESLRFGSLPLELVAQEIRTVSATIGGDVLNAGLISGILGLILVAIYLLAYYRLAGLVAIGGLLLSGAMLWTIVAWFGARYGLALSLAGVVGLIVSIGVSADSNIVYFENVKEAYNSGRKIPTSIERAYRSAISTIIKADVVSLIAAVLLYVLTVGAVRGFAFYLGLATILDLITSMFFMRPALNFLARLSLVKKNPLMLGLRGTGGKQ